MLLWVMSVGVDNTCTVSVEWNVYRVILRLYGRVKKTFRLFPFVVEHSVVVMNERLNPMGSQFSIPVLWNLYSWSVVAQTLETQLKTPTLAVWVQLSLRWNNYVLFNTDIVNFVWRIDEVESIVLLIFVFWQCLNLRWLRGGGAGQKVLFKASWNRIFFQPVFLTFKSNFI